MIARPLAALRGSSAKRPICVLGMGRSGTSLTTALLGLLGVYLGPEERMLEAVEHDNARGYWEQSEIYEINKEIMAAFGGSVGVAAVSPSGLGAFSHPCRHSRSSEPTDRRLVWGLRWSLGLEGPAHISDASVLAPADRADGLHPLHT